MNMSKLLLILVFSLLVLTTPALAQDTQPAAAETATLTDLQIALWPEYDRPEMLVIYRGLFAPDTPLPVAVEIRLPARIGQPTAVAYVDEAGQRFNQQHTTRVEDDQLVVSFELTTPGFQLEYYDDLPKDSAGMREYAFTYAADYPITALNLEFQVPPTADAFTLDPPGDSVITEGDGLAYHLVRKGPLAGDETLNWTLAYQKGDEEMTASGFVQAPTPAAAAPTTSDSDNSTVLIFLVAFVALVAVGAGAYWVGRRAQSIPESAPPPKRQKRRGSGKGSASPPQRLSLSDLEEAAYCHKCGTQLRHDSEFCHKCGAEVRRG
jgi:hypothetical protein